MATLHRVTILLDWDSVRRICPSRYTDDRDFEVVFARIQSAVLSILAKRAGKAGYRVDWRVYHGWHRGKTKTPDRMRFESYVRSARARTVKNVSFSTNFAYSEILCCGSSRAPILDTLRSDRDSGQDRQKMVDTMLACDLLHIARTKDSSLLIVVAADDDFVPALFTAEAWNANVVWLHLREQVNSFLNLRGIVEVMNSQ